MDAIKRLTEFMSIVVPVDGFSSDTSSGSSFPEINSFYNNIMEK